MRAARRFVPTLTAGLLLAVAATGDALAVNRCEGRDGRVTYTDEPCPTGARGARRVDDSPPVQVREAATDEPASKDAAKDAAREPAREAAKAARPADAAAGIAAGGRIANSGTPEQQIQQLDEQYARQRRECADLSRRIDYARADLDAALTSQRASAELALRRLQEQFKSQCPRR